VRLPTLALVLAALACNAPPSDRREWRASDHDHTENPGANQVVGGPDAGTAPELAKHGLNELAIVTWQQNCVRCHGRLGHGDGPQGKLTRATDLSNPAWQNAATDDQILKTIREGRGLMPAFPLPDSTLRSLLQLVRLIGKATEEAPAASASAIGAASAPLPRTSGPPRLSPPPVKSPESAPPARPLPAAVPSANAP
jgi:mono/diheme cytochrome c family protein